MSIKIYGGTTRNLYTIRIERAEAKEKNLYLGFLKRNLETLNKNQIAISSDIMRSLEHYIKDTGGTEIPVGETLFNYLSNLSIAKMRDLALKEDFCRDLVDTLEYSYRSVSEAGQKKVTGRINIYISNIEPTTNNGFCKRLEMQKTDNELPMVGEPRPDDASPAARLYRRIKELRSTDFNVLSERSIELKTIRGEIATVNILAINSAAITFDYQIRHYQESENKAPETERFPAVSLSWAELGNFAIPEVPVLALPLELLKIIDRLYKA